MWLRLPLRSDSPVSRPSSHHPSWHTVQHVSYGRFVVFIWKPRHITSVYLMHNDITSFCPSLKSISSIEILHLEFNNIEHLKWDCFLQLVTLVEFKASGNKIDNMPDGLLKNTDNLIVVSVSENHIRSIDSRLLEHFRYLEIVDLSDNYLTCLEPWPLQIAVSNPVVVIILDGNPISRFRKRQNLQIWQIYGFYK